MTRLDALAKATELVDELAPRKNERGFSDRGVITPAERVALMLQIADWLLAGEAIEMPLLEAPHACFKCLGTTGEIVNDGPFGRGRWMHAYGMCPEVAS